MIIIIVLLSLFSSLLYREMCGFLRSGDLRKMVSVEKLEISAKLSERSGDLKGLEIVRKIGDLRKIVCNRGAATPQPAS